jgi:hypothetical protein
VTKSWRLKLVRAQEHFEQFRSGVGRYTDGNPYTLERVRRPRCPEHGGACIRYRLKLTSQPPPELSVVLGDVLFNLRSALDHLAVAIAPRNRRWNASFPIERVEFWEEKDDELIIPNADAWGRFCSDVKGMPPEAIQHLKEFQPLGDEGETHPLHLLSRLENADKHRELVLLTSGLTTVTATISVRGDTLAQPMPEPEGATGLVDDGWQVIHAGWGGTPLRDDEITVTIAGMPHVTVPVIEARNAPDRRGAHTPIVDLVAGIMKGIESDIVPSLEPFARERDERKS